MVPTFIKKTQTLHLATSQNGLQNIERLLFSSLSPFRDLIWQPCSWKIPAILPTLTTGKN